MKVLIIRLSAMGDIIHGLPAAALLKDRLPGLELSWLVEPAGIPLLAGNTAIDKVIVFPKKQWLKQLRSVSGIPATVAGATTFFKDLKSSKYEAVLDLQGLLKSSVPALLSGANLRFGFKGTREGADRLLTHPLDVGDYFGSQTHVVEHNLKLAEYASRVLLGKDTSDISGSPGQSYIYDALRFPLPAPGAESRQKLDTLIGESDSQPLLAFIPGTTWHTKIWPVEKWIELASLCLSQSGSKIVLIGGPSEREMNAQIASKFAEGVINLTEKTEIADLIGLFSKTALVVGADTGPLHLAAAVGKAPVVAIFGSTPASRNGPYGAQCSSVSLKLECQPCFEKVCPIKTLACLKELAAETVFQQLAPHLLE